MMHERTKAEKLTPRSLAVSAIVCALAFSLTFFIQELGLVLPKALVPGLDPRGRELKAHRRAGRNRGGD